MCNFTAEVGGCGGGGGTFAELKLCAVLLVRVWRSLSPSPQVLSGANGHRHCPSRCAVAGNLMTGTAARTWFVATLAFALAGCGGAGMGQRPPVISAFTASPTDAVHRITLSWTVSGATDLSISGVGASRGKQC